jgi:hypothetical protein
MATFVLLCWCVIPIRASSAQDHALPAQRWAIIAADQPARSLADLLTVQLSGADDLELVEREQIARVLAELRLQASGLADHDRAINFAQLSKADAVVLINAGDQAEAGQLLRVRLIDARSSIRLLDTVLASENLEQQVADIQAELQTAAASLAVAGDDLRMISVVPIVSAEPGNPFASQCETLTALVAAEFHRLPQFIVLEREDLERLTAESKLSGLELQLRGATRLLQTTIRRDETNTGWIATCRLVAPVSGQSQTFEVRAASNSPGDLRSQIVGEVHRRVALEEHYQTGSLEQEAQTFDRRARQFQSAYRPAEALVMTEAAFALVPTTKRRTELVRLLAHSVSEHLKATDWLEALRRSRRHNELLLDGLQESGEGAIRAMTRLSTNEAKKRFPPPMAIGYGRQYDAALRATTSEEQQLLAEINALRHQRNDLRIRLANGHPLQTLIHTMAKYDLELSYALPDANIAQRVIGVLGEIYAWAEKAEVKHDLNDPFYRCIVLKLCQTVRKFERQRTTPEPGWDLSKANRWFDCLQEVDPQLAQILRLRMETRDRGEPGLQAARKLLAITQEFSLQFSDGLMFFEKEMVSPALSRLPAAEREQYIMDLLANAETAQDPTALVLHAGTFRALLSRLPAEQQRRIGRRIAPLLKLDHPANKSRAADVLELAAVQQDRIEASMQAFRAKQKAPDFSLNGAPGPWQEYFARPIRLTPTGKAYNVVHVHADDRDDARQRGGELILFWALPYKGLYAERLNLATGKQTKLGGDFKGYPVSFRGMQVAVSPQAIFVSSDQPGFTMITKDAVKTYADKEGVVNNDIWSMTWWKDRLYIAYRDAFGTFDPETEAFQLIASSLSVEARNPIDARGSFFIRQLTSDPSAGCIWMTIQDNASRGGRDGLWRFEPEANSFEKITLSHTKISLTPSGLLVHLNREPWIGWIPRGSTELKPMAEFSDASAKSPAPSPPLIRMDNYIVSERGKLFTEQGQSFQAPLTTDRWKMLQRVGERFVTHYDQNRKTLWVIEPKK